MSAGTWAALYSRQRRRAIVPRHARAVVSIFESFDKGNVTTPEQVQEIREARKVLNVLRERASTDLEATYKKDWGLAREATGGDFSRTNRAMLHETELRTSPTRRADEFVERWNKLNAQAERAYVSEDLADRKSAQNAMAGMAQSLEHDPQMESILSARKAQLGISMETGAEAGCRPSVPPRDRLWARPGPRHRSMKAFRSALRANVGRSDTSSLSPESRRFTRRGLRA